MRHLLGDDSAAQVEEWTIDSKTNVDDLAARIVDRAIDDAESIGERQRYFLQAHFGDDVMPSGRFGFYLLGGPVESGDVGVSEPPNARGLLSQLMRHNEANLRVALGAAGEILRQQTRVIELQNQRLEGMESRHFDVVEAAEGLRARSISASWMRKKHTTESAASTR